MRGITTMRIMLLLLVAALCMQADGAERRRKVRRKPDTLALAVAPPELSTSRKMNTSVFPVQITVTGRMVQIQSDQNQLLPIYTRSGGKNRKIGN